MFLDIYFNKRYKEAINLLDQKGRIKAHERVFQRRNIFFTQIEEVRAEETNLPFPKSSFSFKIKGSLTKYIDHQKVKQLQNNSKNDRRSTKQRGLFAQFLLNCPGRNLLTVPGTPKIIYPWISLGKVCLIDNTENKQKRGRQWAIF